MATNKTSKCELKNINNCAAHAKNGLNQMKFVVTKTKKALEFLTIWQILGQNLNNFVSRLS